MDEPLAADFMLKQLPFSMQGLRAAGPISDWKFDLTEFGCNAVLSKTLSLALTNAEI